MKKLLIIPVMLLLCGFTYNAWKIVITVSEADADIFINGSKVGLSPQEIRVRQGDCAMVEVKKTGFLSQKIKLCVGIQGVQEPKKKQFITLEKDEAYNSSVSSDIANNDIGINTTKTEDKAWKLLSEIVTTYFDVLEVSDKSAGYIRTSWVIEPFNGSTIRTRVIIKASSMDAGMNYKAKIQSEYAEGANVSAKDDEKFKPWARILKKYDGLIIELQSRLK